MNYESPFACIANDTGLVSEILHVSPVFVRFGRPSRGRYPGQRLARTRRTDCRHERRVATAFRDIEPVTDRAVAVRF